MQPTLADVPFRRLVKENAELAELRRQYESKPAKERRSAAQWEYDSALATEMFNIPLLQAASDSDYALPSGEGPCPGAVLALAIDPQFAPALLTVGSVEYQAGRQDEAMQLFMNLTTLSAETEDLAEMIDKAGDFLIDEEDYTNAKILYAASAQEHPNVALYHGGLGYCLGKLNKLNEALECARRAVELEPNSHYYLNDLGWALVEAKLYDEAEDVLKKAVELAPDDYEFAKNNLEELRCKKRLAAKTK